MKQKHKDPAYPQHKPKKTTAEVALAAAKAQLDENATELAALQAEVNNLKKLVRDFVRIENEYDYAVAMFKQYGVYESTCGKLVNEAKHPLQFGVDIVLAGWLKAEADDIIRTAYDELYKNLKKPEPPAKA